MYVRRLTDQEMETLGSAEYMEDDYTDMWRTFFSAVSVEQRENYRCQRSMFPLWSRKHATEFGMIIEKCLNWLEKYDSI